MKYIYGLDLSLNSTGVSVFTNDGIFVKTLTIDTHSERETKLKLKLIGEKFIDLLKEYPPSIVVIEQGFTRFNASTQAIFRVHGLVNYLFADIEQVYYPAMSVKKIVGGKGNMTKDEVERAIHMKYPGIEFRNYDESDAFAVAIAYMLEKGIK